MSSFPRERKETRPNRANLLDRVICTLAPKWGAKRLAYREFMRVAEQNAGHLRKRSIKGAETDDTRKNRFVTEDWSVDSMLEDQLKTLQLRAVGLYEENSIAHAAVEARVAYEVGEGLNLQATIKHDDSDRERISQINAELENTMVEWSGDGVDKTRTMSFGQLQRVITRTFANYGEAFILLGDQATNGRLTLAVELITPERVETPPRFSQDPLVRLGVRYSMSGLVVGYYVRKTHPNDDKEYSVDYDYYPRFDQAGQARMVHVFDPLFPGQSRGIPWLAAALNKILDFDDYLEAEILAKQVEACFGLVFKKSTGAGESLLDIVDANTTENSDGDKMETIKPGFIQYIHPDDEITTVDPQRPGSSFAPFTEHTLRAIAAAGNIPYEVIAKNFFRTTFSSGRLAVLDGNMGFTMRRSVLIDRGLSPIYRRVVHARVWEDEIGGLLPIEEYVADPRRYHAHKWHGKLMGLIDPQKEIGAYTEAIENKLLTKADFHSERGDDWERAEQQVFEEERCEIDRKLELEKYEMEQRQSMGLPDPMAADQDQEQPEPAETE